MPILLKNGLILINKELSKRDLLISKGIIEKIEKDIPIETEMQVIDCSNLFVSPGLIDMHVHLREPGFTNKETIKTGTMSAAAGGYTLVCPMPNVHPAPDTVEKIDYLNKLIAQDAIVKVLPYAPITIERKEGTELVDMENLRDKVVGFSNDGFGIQSTKTMYLAMLEAYKYEKFIAAHCEDEGLLFDGYVHNGLKSKREGWKGMTSLSESVQIARDVLIAEETGARYHVCHISTKEGVRIIKNAKSRGVNVTAEVTPHHLLLTDNDVINTNYKMNPPVRGLDDKYSLIGGLLDGTIDVIATDHAPHTLEEKNQGMKDAPFGVVGLETAFPLIYTNLVRTNIVSLNDLINWMSINPAKVLNLEYGKLIKGRIADITIIDLNKKKVINSMDFYSKGKNTPFNGWSAYGWPVMTIVDGKIVFNEMRDKING